jgi:hypothetical protein
MGCDLVQGYYFSKPVPPEAFDHFLIERAEAKVEMTPSDKKTYMSISKALTSDFENIFYVDVLTDFYLEFFTDEKGDLEIRPGGVDFFGDAKDKILEGVNEADKDKVADAISKYGLVSRMGSDDTLALTFRKIKNGKEKTYSLQTIKTRESDNNHVVIGLKCEAGGDK